MEKVSGFTFVHDGIYGGYPIIDAILAVARYLDEIVVVDMGCTDNTITAIQNASKRYWDVPVRILKGDWTPGGCESCLDRAYYMSYQCYNDVIWFFEADEVFSDRLARHIHEAIWASHHYVSVYRAQVEQNFQRIRWYPDDPILRVFRKKGTTRRGHTAEIINGESPYVIPIEEGLLWDVTNCFRDTWWQRLVQNGELWGESPQTRYVPYHFTLAPDRVENVKEFLAQPHWTWKDSPFALPALLQRLVGVTSYEQDLIGRRIL